MNKKLFTVLLLSLNLGCLAKENEHIYPYPHFYDNPRIDDRMQGLMAPYLLPLDHPIKDRLDLIFSDSRAIRNKRSLTDAGFEIIFSRPDKFITVARHPAIPGFVFKLYLDSEKRTRSNRPNWEWLTLRCIGAEKIRNLIRKEHIRHFTVPDKWLYVLPAESAPKSPDALPVILVATDMQLHSKETSEIAWKTRITREHLDELYLILKHGYGSTAPIKNIPYTRNDTFAFTDTEYPQRKLNLDKIKHRFSEKMQKYWEHLIN